MNMGTTTAKSLKKKKQRDEQLKRIDGLLKKVEKK